MTNRQKKIISAMLVVTWPIWVVPVVLLYVVSGIALLLYASICDAMGVK